MAKPGENEDKGGSFDLEKFRKLLQLMEKFGVTEANLQNEQESWKVRRGPRTVNYGAAMPMAAPMMTPAPAPAAPQATAPAAAPAVPAEKPAGITISAPTVGTFYAAPNPEEPPFVTIGTVVKPESVVCTIEAMKVFNEIKAEKSGRIVEILVENGAAVEFGQPLFRLEAI
ncbi:MAG: acetyl-CoA carboxylase biotin carboxyl carrier protein [Planctomycetaceae bacterium]|nr:acetyl-CoA carboxylase biotin carboxyl carrier protein [Planctomycetaceae bacterium]